MRGIASQPIRSGKCPLKIDEQAIQIDGDQRGHADRCKGSAIGEPARTEIPAGFAACAKVAPQVCRIALRRLLPGCDIFAVRLVARLTQTNAPPLPLPRSEMAWAAAEGNRMHVIGGYGAGQVARAYHHVFEASRGEWLNAVPIPRGANHVGVAAADGVVYAFGGFVEQNRIAVPDCYAYVVAEDRWHVIHPLSRGSRGAISIVAGNRLIHAIGGRDT